MVYNKASRTFMRQLLPYLQWSPACREKVAAKVREYRQNLVLVHSIEMAEYLSLG
jgi:hypothetical protein